MATSSGPSGFQTRTVSRALVNVAAAAADVPAVSPVPPLTRARLPARKVSGGGLVPSPGARRRLGTTMSQTPFSGAESPADLLRSLLEADPARPLITFYDDATGERVELSVKTFDNWVAKTANL